MPRARQISELPPLKALFNKDAVSKIKKGTFVREFANLLRQSIKPYQSERALLLYGSRELAAFFQIHQTTVIRTMALLESEGLLMRVRGAGIFLRPKYPKSRSGIKGVVGFPVWQYAYCMLAEWRLFYDQLEDKLRQNNFVANLIFLKGSEHTQLLLTKKLLDHKLDHLVWFRPLSGYMPVMHSLFDSGVSIWVIDDSNVSYPFPTYVLHHSRQLHKRLREWKTIGVNKWQILIEAAYRPRFEKEINLISNKLNLKIEILEIDSSLKKYPALKDLQNHASGIILHESMATLSIHRQYGLKFVKILKQKPVITLHHLDAVFDGWMMVGLLIYSATNGLN